MGIMNTDQYGDINVDVNPVELIDVPNDATEYSYVYNFKGKLYCDPCMGEIMRLLWMVHHDVDYGSCTPISWEGENCSLCGEAIV